MLDSIALNVAIQMKSPELIDANALIAVVAECATDAVLTFMREVLASESHTAGSVGENDGVRFENTDLCFQ